MNLKSFTILYVEDEEDLQNLMQDFLEDEVKSLYLASDGEEGLKKFYKYNPDIVISDIYMPKVNGLDMCKEIRSKFPQKPIILLTAFSDSEDMKKAIEIGVNYYINKPIISLNQIERPLLNLSNILTTQKENQRIKQLLAHEARCNAMGEMISNIAHQWRQPLGAISAECSAVNLKMELGKKINEEELQDFIDSLNKKVQYISSTLDNFKLHLSGTQNVERNVSLEQLITYSLSIVSSSIKENNITVVKRLDDVKIQGNFNYFVEVLINLMNNAIDAITKNQENKGYIFIESNIGNESVELSIKDSGGGIEKDIIEKLFDPYFTTKFQKEGVGLGLFIVQKFLKQFGASVEAKNTQFTHENQPINGAELLITFKQNEG